MDVSIVVKEEHGENRRHWPLTRGVPLPKGRVEKVSHLGVRNESGIPIPAQFRVLSLWPDGSIKWVLVDFNVDVDAHCTVVFTVHVDQAARVTSSASTIRVEHLDEVINVDTGPLSFSVNRTTYGLLDKVLLSTTGGSCSSKVAYDAGEHGRQGDAWVRINESHSDGGTKRRIYGMGGVCRASLAPEAYSVKVEESGPLRVVLRCDAVCEADIPMHHYSGYRPFHLTTRIYAYAGQRYLRVLHTVVVACNPRETKIDEIALKLPCHLSGAIRCSTSSDLAGKRILDSDDVVTLGQGSYDQWSVSCRQSDQVDHIDMETANEGWMVVDGEESGMGVALRHMPEAFPCALEVGGDGTGITAYLWKDPEGKSLDLARYSEEVAWHEGEGVYADGMGTARTRELFLTFFEPSERDVSIRLLKGLLNPPHAALDPPWAAACDVTGGFEAQATEHFPQSDGMLTGFADWMLRGIELGKWFSYLDHGDVLAAWDEEENDWRFKGRWGWCNSEWDPRHGLWIQYLRTGRACYFDVAEAMTRHSLDVDTCHYHPIRTYMVGGSFRHSMDHFSDEPCASHTFIDNWVDYYYLTGDLRARDVIVEAGAFFMRYRWSTDPKYSFSLRSFANVLRGLLHVYEVTGETRYLSRAEEVFDIFAQAQNSDGSWHKRFQVSTADKLPERVPYGMATEGTTLAVEMGTSDPFTDEEYRGLGGPFNALVREMPLAEQKGYQTHYLMIGIELLHRITGRDDVALVYRRAVDWFCGQPGSFDRSFALQEHYGGILCRHLGYAYRLTQDRRYLDVGIVILQELLATQNWSEDPRKRGAIGMSPTYLSLVFFGVPYFLSALKAAGIDEGGLPVRP